MPRTAAGRVAARCVGTSTTTTRRRRTMRVRNSCTPRAGTVDAVDNCFLVAPGTAGGETGPFSHYFGYSSFDTSARSTPSATSTRCSRTTSWTPGTLRCRRFASTCGSPLAASGRSRRRTRTTSTSATARRPTTPPHNLYAPFYKAYVPAAGPSFTFSDRSGVAGAFVSNNFPGYQNSGVYDYYDLVGQLD